MRLLVYEHLTATGPDDGSSMYREGQAMRDALTDDLAAIPGVRIVEQDPDLAIVVAPETDGILEAVVARMRRNHPVLASSSHALALTRDKLELFQHWSAHGVPTPFTTRLEAWPRSRLPAVVKPIDGAGSCATWLCRTIEDFERSMSGMAQDYIPGRAASLAFLIGANQTYPLVPTYQNLSTDGRFQYLGGELPIPDGHSERAIALGRRAVGCIPGLAGYVGVDLILGRSAREDVAIEINPRLTTSYVGLRALARFNIAEAMLAIHRGESVSGMSWKSGPVRFSAEGIKSIGNC